MKRISVVGCSGSGKTTLARKLSERWGVPHVELDSLYHQADWTPLARDELRRRVSEHLAQPRWIADGNYTDSVRDLVWAAADTVVWIDLPRAQTTWRVVKRSLGRVAKRKTLWNGNRERIANLVNPDPRDNIVLWAWTKHPAYRRDYAAATRDPAWAHLDFIRLRSQREVDAFAEGRDHATEHPSHV